MSFNTCMGVLSADRLVNPTMSLKYIVTSLKLSASTLPFLFSCSATGLLEEQHFVAKISYLLLYILLQCFLQRIAGLLTHSLMDQTLVVVICFITKHILTHFIIFNRPFQQ